MSLACHRAPAIDQKIPKVETNANRVLNSDACANVCASYKCHHRSNTIGHHTMRPASHNHLTDRCTPVIGIGVFPLALLQLPQNVFWKLRAATEPTCRKCGFAGGSPIVVGAYLIRQWNHLLTFRVLVDASGRTFAFPPLRPLGGFGLPIPVQLISHSGAVSQKLQGVVGSIADINVWAYQVIQQHRYCVA